ESEAIAWRQADYQGGNMDLPDVAPGAILYFPVHVKGGFLYVGDCHAAQGDGELSGVAIEQRATVTMQIDVIKGWSFAWPRLETKDFVMTIGSARPLEDAARIAYRELVRWMSADYGFDEIEAYMLLSQAGRIRLGNMVDPKYTMGASVLKKYLTSGIICNRREDFSRGWARSPPRRTQGCRGCRGARGRGQGLRIGIVKEGFRYPSSEADVDAEVKAGADLLRILTSRRSIGPPPRSKAQATGGRVTESRRLTGMRAGR